MDYLTTFKVKWNTPTHSGNWKNRKAFVEYSQWRAMRLRCNSEKFKSLHTTYKDCSYVQDWESYDEYLDWASNQVGFLCSDSEGKVYHLDKDLLVKGNKLYSPDTCCFLPKEVNTFLRLNEYRRTSLPAGVRRRPSGRFEAYIVDDKWKGLGTYDSLEQAFSVYKNAREEKAISLALKYKGTISAAAYQALIHYTITVQD